MSVLSSLINNVASQLTFIITILILTGVIAYIVYSYWAIKRSQYRLQYTELDLASKRSDFEKRRKVIESLRNDSVGLAQKEEKDLEVIRRDQNLLTKKMVYNISEIEERTARLELGVETAKLFETLSEVKRHETSLFGKE